MRGHGAADWTNSWLQEKGKESVAVGGSEDIHNGFDLQYQGTASTAPASSGSEDIHSGFGPQAVDIHKLWTDWTWRAS